jgi:hypothetical protein
MSPRVLKGECRQGRKSRGAMFPVARAEWREKKQVSRHVMRLIKTRRVNKANQGAFRLFAVESFE